MKRFLTKTGPCLTVQYSDFVLTPSTDGHRFRCEIMHKDGCPFGVGREITRVFYTMTRFVSEAEALAAAQLVADSATMEK